MPLTLSNQSIVYNWAFVAIVQGASTTSTLALTTNPGGRWSLAGRLLTSSQPLVGDTPIVTETLVGGGSTAYPFPIGVRDLPSTLQISGQPAPALIGQSPIFTPDITGGATPYTLRALSKLPAGRYISGLSVVGPYLTTGPNVYELQANDATGAFVRLTVNDPVGEIPPGDPTILQTALFSKTLQIGVALSGVTIIGTDVQSSVVSNVPGVTINDTVYPPIATGTPLTSGTVGAAIVETQGGAIGSPFVSATVVLAGAPIITVQPTLSGTAQIGQTLTCVPGAADGSTVPAYQWFRRLANGVVQACNGSFGATYILTDTNDRGVSDVGAVFYCRVRWFRGTLPATAFTNETVAAIAAGAGQPTFTTASSFTGGPGVGATLTAVGGAGTGTLSVQWVADDIAIPGATNLTYVQQWADRYKALKPVFTRTNGAGAIVDPTVLTPIVCTPILTAEYFGNPSWFDGSTMRYMTPALATPYEPGKNGTAKIGPASSARNRTFDKRHDVYIRGDTHFENGGAPIGNILSLTRGRNGVITGYSSGGKKVAWNGAYGKVHFLGIEGDFDTASDFLFYGGRESDPLSYQTTYIQGCRGTRVIGTYANPYIVANNPASGLNEASVLTSQRINATQVRFMLGAIPTDGRAPLPSTVDSNGKTIYNGYLIVYGVQVSPGVTTDLNADWMTNYEVVSYDPATGECIAVPAFMGDGNPDYFTPAIGQSGVPNTGKAVILSKVADNHSDGAQKNKGVAGPTFRHNNTWTGNYTVWGIDINGATGSDNSVRDSCTNVKRYFGYNPQEYRAQLIYTGSSTGSVDLHEFVNVTIDSVWTGVSFGQLVYPGDGQGATLSSVDGYQYLDISGPNRENWRGGVMLKSVPDRAPARASWLNYSCAFHGQRNPVAGDMTALTLTPYAFAASAPVGTEIGQLMLANALPFADASARYPIIYDFEITGPDAAKVSQGWSGILYTAATISAPITISVAAVVRDSAANYGAAVRFGPVPITITPG